MVSKNKKIGGGASLRVFSLARLQVKDCLDDLQFYAKNKQMDQYKDDLIEALASIVEFDGLETTQDPSPRSTLTMTMYNDSKAIYVKRMLAERVTPITQGIVGWFGSDVQTICESYIRDYYPSELPPKPIEPVQPVSETIRVEDS
jgi:hypothetical protein